MLAPFRYIERNIREINILQYEQLAQFTVYKNGSAISVLEIIRDNSNKVYIMHGDTFLEANRNNISIQLLLHNIYRGYQIDISVTGVHLDRDDVGINTIHELISNKASICNIINTIGDGVFQGDVYLH
jgi:hypothetical protein